MKYALCSCGARKMVSPSVLKALKNAAVKVCPWQLPVLRPAVHLQHRKCKATKAALLFFTIGVDLKEICITWRVISNLTAKIGKF